MLFLHLVASPAGQATEDETSRQYTFRVIFRAGCGVFAKVIHRIGPGSEPDPQRIILVKPGEWYPVRLYWRASVDAKTASAILSGLPLNERWREVDALAASLPYPLEDSWALIAASLPPEERGKEPPPVPQITEEVPPAVAALRKLGASVRDVFNAVLISPESEIDKILNAAYLAKRPNPQTGGAL